MCNKLVASPSLIDFHYYYQRDKTAREREGESRVKAVLELISAVSWPGQATKYFECTWDISLEPQRLPHCCQNISMRFVWCPPLLSTFFYHSGSGSLGPTCCAVFWWDLNMTADLLTVCLSASLSPPLSLSPSFSVCLCVCVSWLSSLLDKLNLLFSVFQYKRQACYDKNWLLSKWNLFPPPPPPPPLPVSPLTTLQCCCCCCCCIPMSRCNHTKLIGWSGASDDRSAVPAPHSLSNTYSCIYKVSVISVKVWVICLGRPGLRCCSDLRLGDVVTFFAIAMQPTCRKCGSGWCMCGKAILFAAFWLWEIKRPQGR